ncbi:hypothetical protein M011DRAFT_527138 [Sporormia fimetaria CBS 119925]|uniref:Uncharacterized protein n=1 Tax=Sporormia fimetaria CBS 119925 TaxID=1340428 RepID=A0A6A6V8X9_9PLEO|nr:hypothetical protein M011DRAFT_527138 [Sporormia fimetaria CBS 119925]
MQAPQRNPINTTAFSPRPANRPNHVPAYRCMHTSTPALQRPSCGHFAGPQTTYTPCICERSSSPTGRDFFSQTLRTSIRQNRAGDFSSSSSRILRSVNAMRAWSVFPINESCVSIRLASSHHRSSVDKGEAEKCDDKALTAARKGQGHSRFQQAGPPTEAGIQEGTEQQ